MFWKLLSTPSPCSFPRYAVACVLTEALSMVVGEGLYFPHVLHGFGDVYTFRNMRMSPVHCLLQQCFPTFSYHGMHRI